MRVTYITAGAAEMICGSCLRDNNLARELRSIGCSVVFVPVYTPITVEGEDASDNALLFGGISVYLEQNFPLFRHLPGFLTRWLDRPGLVKFITKRRPIEVEAKKLGELTLSILRGEEGNQQRSLTRAVKWIKRKARPDLLNLTNLLIAGFVPALKRELNVPVIVTLQGDDLFLDELSDKHRPLIISELRKLAAGIDGFITFSDFYANKMSELLEVPREKFAIVSLGIDTREFAGLVHEPSQDPTIGYFGRIAPEKGFEQAVEAFIQIHTEHRLKNIRLRSGGWLSPSDQGFFEQQLNKIESANLSQMFEYIGAPDLQRKKEFFSSIDVFSLPTIHEEPKGLSVLEAQASAVPVVQPKHGIFPEILAKTKGGILYTPSDSTALSIELAKLLTDTEQADNLGKTGRINTVKLFSDRKMAEETLQVYEQFTERSK